MYSIKAAGLSDEPGCCLHGNKPCNGCWTSVIIGDDVFGLCSSKNADVTDDGDDVSVKGTRCDDVVAAGARCELQRKFNVHPIHCRHVHGISYSLFVFMIL